MEYVRAALKRLRAPWSLFRRGVISANERDEMASRTINQIRAEHGLPPLPGGYAAGALADGESLHVRFDQAQTVYKNKCGRTWDGTAAEVTITDVVEHIDKCEGASKT